MRDILAQWFHAGCVPALSLSNEKTIQSNSMLRTCYPISAKIEMGEEWLIKWKWSEWILHILFSFCSIIIYYAILCSIFFATFFSVVCVFFASMWAFGYAMCIILRVHLSYDVSFDCFVPFVWTIQKVRTHKHNHFSFIMRAKQSKKEKNLNRVIFLFSFIK